LLTGANTFLFTITLGVRFWTATDKFLFTITPGVPFLAEADKFHIITSSVRFSTEAMILFNTKPKTTEAQSSLVSDGIHSFLSSGVKGPKREADTHLNTV
jgi:hypothetical protein